MAVNISWTLYDFFNMVMPGWTGDRWFIGVSEI
jgi:hypothetical protein